MNREIEDGFGCAGLVPTAEEKRQENREKFFLTALSAARDIIDRVGTVDANSTENIRRAEAWFEKYRSTCFTAKIRKYD